MPNAKQLSMMPIDSATASSIAAISLRLNSCSTYEAMSSSPLGLPMPAAAAAPTAAVTKRQGPACLCILDDTAKCTKQLKQSKPGLRVAVRSRQTMQ